MSKKYPYQNPVVEEASGLTKKMQEQMKIMERDEIRVSEIEKFIIGDLFKIDDENVSLLSKPQRNSLPSKLQRNSLPSKPQRNSLPSKPQRNSLIGDLFKIENENISLLSKPQKNSPLCW